jgi:homoserine dehydrogenase
MSNEGRWPKNAAHDREIRPSAKAGGCSIALRFFDVTDSAKIGLLGLGTVGAAFRDLLTERGDAIEAAAGRRPEIAGVLRRSEGDFDGILERSEILVELIGGTDPARDYVLRALRAGRHVVTANKQLIAQFGDELFAAAREAGVQLRFEAAVAGVVPVIRVIQESLAATEIAKVFGIVNGTTNFILTEMANTGDAYEDALRRAQELGYAEADPTEDVCGADAAAKMAILARLAFGAPVALDDVAYEGITEIRPDDIAYAKELGLSLKLLGVAERRDGGISVRVFPCFLYPHHPLAPVEGPFNAVMVEAPTITEITMSGPGAGGVETASAVLGDVVSILSGRAPVHAARESLEIVRDISSSFYLHLEVADRPGVLARIADVLGRNQVSVRSVVQRGLGDDARLVMIMHECPEAWFFKALEEIATLEFLRAQPRAIRVIEEEFV